MKKTLLLTMLITIASSTNAETYYGKFGFGMPIANCIHNGTVYGQRTASAQCPGYDSLNPEDESEQTNPKPDHVYVIKDDNIHHRSCHEREVYIIGSGGDL